MKQKVYLYVFDTMADWEVGYLTAELRSGRYFRKGYEPIEIVTISNNRNPIITMGGLRVMPDLAVREFDPAKAAALVLPGGNTWTERAHDPVLALANQCLKNEILVAAICGATFGLARFGLLNHLNHTSNDLQVLKMLCPNYTGEKQYRYEPAVTDQNLITASGIAPLDFTAHILKKLDLFLPEVLSAWQQLYQTYDPKYFFEIMRLVQ